MRHPYLPFRRDHPLVPLLARPHQPTANVIIYSLPDGARQSYLIEVSLQEVDLLRVLEQPWPELLLQLLLAEDHLDVLGGVVDLAVLDIDLGVELQLDVVCLLQAV